MINNVRQEPLIQTMYNQKVIPQPAFTIVFNDLLNPILFNRQPSPGAHMLDQQAEHAMWVPCTRGAQPLR